MMYRPLMSITGGAAVALGLVCLIVPQVYLSLYLPPLATETPFAARRFAPAIAGLGAILWLARDLTPKQGPFAARLATVGACVWFGVAATGMFHFLTGVAGIAILVAALSECILAVLFLTAAREMRPV